MKTIEILSGSQKVQFTTKSATFDNKEFLYAHMTHVVNDAENCTYTFTYEGETKTLPYLEKDAKVLNAIFSQVQKIDAMKKKNASAANEKPAESEKPVAETTPVEEVVSEEKPTEEIAEEKPVEEKQKKSLKGLFSKVKSNDSEEIAEGEEKEKTPVDPEKQARLKKSLKIFAIVIAAVIALSIVYYFIFGTNNAPTGNNIPGNSETQQYEDIDQLIEDLQ